MGPRKNKGSYREERRRPISHGIRIPNIGMGAAAEWKRVRSPRSLLLLTGQVVLIESIVKHVYSSRRERIGTATLTQMICSNRLIMQLISLNKKLTGLQLVFSCLIMLPVTRGEHQMHSPRRRCPKTPTQLGDITKMGQRCESPLLDPITCPRTFTSPTIILQCLDGSRAWS